MTSVFTEDSYRFLTIEPIEKALYTLKILRRSGKHGRPLEVILSRELKEKTFFYSEIIKQMKLRRFLIHWGQRKDLPIRFRSWILLQRIHWEYIYTRRRNSPIQQRPWKDLPSIKKIVWKTFIQRWDEEVFYPGKDPEGFPHPKKKKYRKFSSLRWSIEDLESSKDLL